MPSGVTGSVRSIECNSEACTIARAGDNVAICLQGVDIINVIAGGVICQPDFPVSIARRLELKVLVLDFAMPILIGSQVSQFPSQINNTVLTSQYYSYLTIGL